MKMSIRDIILCCIFAFCFVFLLCWRIFAEDITVEESTSDTSVLDLDKRIGSVPLSELWDNQEDYEKFKRSLPASIQDDFNALPLVSDGLNAVGSYAVGNYAAGSDAIMDLILDFTDTTGLGWQIINDTFFNWDTLSFVFGDNVQPLIKSGVDQVIYTEPSATIGKWQPLPFGPVYNSRWPNLHGYFRPQNGASPYVAFLNSNGTFLIAYKGDKLNTTFATFTGSAVGDFSFPDWSGQSFYEGSVDSGYYSQLSGAYFTNLSSDIYYSSAGEALSDFFGHEITTDPVLNPEAVIIDNDFSVDPLSLPSILNYDYSTQIVNKYELNDPSPWDPGIVRYYPKDINFEYPYWLTEGDDDVIDYQLPSDYDFTNIEFDYEVDTELFSGAGFIQDVYEVLPSKVTSLIIFCGLGSVAFMFLRR